MMGFHLAQSLSFCSRLLMPPPDFLGAMEHEGKRGGTWKLARKSKREEKETMVGVSDNSRGSGLNNPGAARCRAVPLRAVTAPHDATRDATHHCPLRGRSHFLRRVGMRSEPSRPVTRLPRACRDGSQGAITGKWACAASRHVRSRACRACAVTVPEPHDGAPKGALTVCLSPTRGSLE